MPFDDSFFMHYADGELGDWRKKYEGLFTDAILRKTLG